MFLGWVQKENLGDLKWYLVMSQNYLLNGLFVDTRSSLIVFRVLR